MKQLAAMMMFAAWLLYGAMPAIGMPSMSGPMGSGMTSDMTTDMPGQMMAMSDGHHDMAKSQAGRMVERHAGVMQAASGLPCPHFGSGGGKICIAPFCSACLVTPAEITFADTGRLIHRYPAPERGPSLIVSGLQPLVPPPRV
ncbi:hypothetical protein [Neorhizobium sp. NCHU2750]|uniref:hypothetical protein n=1 Tax=Neorhizobium sp. NCHU2750 TaxID=1825976 RepID=UPI0013C40273